MGAIRASLFAIGMMVATPAAADEVARWQPLIAEASMRFGVPVGWIERVMAAESRGMTRWQGQPITSRAGAMGLMQLMPATWAAMRSRLGLGADPYDPRDNILAGTCYLRLMYDRFGYPGLFGAYNAGPGRYAQSSAGHRQLPRETLAYMAETAGPQRPMVLRMDHVAVGRSQKNLIFFANAASATGNPLPTSVSPFRSSIFVALRGSDAQTTGE